MMKEAVEPRGGDDRIAEHLAPFCKATIGGEDHGAAGKDSVVVPLKLLKVSQDRSSFYLLVTKEAVKAIPVMPDQNYSWLTDEKWRSHNDQLFKQR